MLELWKSPATKELREPLGLKELNLSLLNLDFTSYRKEGWMPVSQLVSYLPGNEVYEKNWYEEEEYEGHYLAL